MFFALRPTYHALNSLEQSLLEVREGSQEIELKASWSLLNNLHITLAFLGDIDQGQIEFFRKIAYEVSNRHESFDVFIEGINAFPNIKQARTLFFDVQNTYALETLADDLRLELGPNVKLEDRIFRPHLTIARMRRKQSVHLLQQSFSTKQFACFKVCEFILYESLSGPKGVEYIPIETFKLKNDVGYENQHPRG